MQARYLDDMVDFGREVTTLAIRLRVVKQWASHADVRGGSCAKDGLGIDPTRCRIFGVAALAYLGGEAPVEALIAERLEIVDGESGRIEREVPIHKPTQLAYAPDGTLYAVAGGAVVQVDLEAGRHRPFETSAIQPGALACDRHGNLYVYDADPSRRVIRVHAPDGAFLRQIGEPGGYKAGPWNPNRFQALSAIAIDREDKLWAADRTYWPKRVSCWTADGVWLRDYLGPTEYGSGGVLDPADKRRLFYGPLEFAIDWQTGASHLKNLTWTGRTPAGDWPIHIGERTYLVTAPSGTRQQRCAIVYLYEAGRLRLAAAMGHADQFAPLDEPEIAAGLGAQSLETLQFLWCDLNGDGQVQFDEVRFAPRTLQSLSRFDEALAIQAGAVAYEVERFLENGVPMYVERESPLPLTRGFRSAEIYRLKNGGFYHFGIGPTLPDAGYGPDGSRLWTYPNEGAGVGPDRSCGPYTPEQVVCQFYVVGHEIAAGGDLGEFFVVNANLGAWNVWTADGLLASRIFRDQRDGRRISWSMLEHDRGMRLDDVTPYQEHFNGSFVRAREDGRYYIVAGKHHASVVEIAGLDEFRRAGGEVEVTAADLDAVQVWRREMVVQRGRETGRVIDCQPVDAADASRIWEVLPPARLDDDPGSPERAVSLRMGRDAVNLYLRVTAAGAGPFRNGGEAWDKLFLGGAAVDLFFGLDPDADSGRRAPVAGDKRVLLALHAGKPLAVLYDAISPGAPPEMRWEAFTPAGGRTTFDVVRRLDEARVTHLELITGGYAVEAVIPLAAIGLDPARHKRIRFDWGILETDEAGVSVLQRVYWSNQAATTLADVPTEARLEPRLWGWALLPGQDRTRPTLEKPFDADSGIDLDALLDDR